MPKVGVYFLYANDDRTQTTPSKVRQMTINETTREEIIDAVTAADLCSPEIVCDAVLAVANAGGDWRAELAKAVANDAAECDAIGVE